MQKQGINSDYTKTGYFLLGSKELADKALSSKQGNLMITGFVQGAIFVVAQRD